nr:hypothetical protein [Mucilaginibacter sp. E4BP6]
MHKITAKILCFLQEIGLIYHLEKIEETTLLPGLQLRNGKLIIDTKNYYTPVIFYTKLVIWLACLLISEKP